MIRTQEYATKAFNKVNEMQSHEFMGKYRTQALGLPSMIMQSGLMQTIGFYLAKGNIKVNNNNNQESKTEGKNEYRFLLEHLISVLGYTDSDNVSSDTISKFHKQIYESSITEYQILTRKSLEASAWIRRYTQALLEKDSSNNSSDDNGQESKNELLRDSVAKILYPNNIDKKNNELCCCDKAKNVVFNSNTAHAGLMIQRGLLQYTDGDKAEKKALINKICDSKPSSLYLRAFERWLMTTYHETAEDNQNTKKEDLDDKSYFANLSATIDGRLYSGLPLGGTLETGVTTHHTYGMPMIAGSAIKGAVRSYTEYLLAKRKTNDPEQIDYFIKKDEKGNEYLAYQFDNDAQEILNILFGKVGDDGENEDAGYLIWHDAWWIPNTGSNPFVSEIVTTHHQKYYNGNLDEALDIESPIPNQQIAVQGSFYFVIEGNKEWEEWTQYALKLLKLTLEHQGLGGKTSSGYGYFKIDNHNEAISHQIGQWHQKLQKAYQAHLEQIELNKTATPAEKIKVFLTQCNENILFDELSCNKSKFFQKLGLDHTLDAHKQLVANIIYQKYKKEIEQWENSIKNNAKKAFKFIMKNKS